PVQSLVTELGLQSALKLWRIQQRWGTLFKGSLAQHSMPSFLREGVLRVNVDSSAWMQELSYQKAAILQKLAPLGVKEVKFIIGRIFPVEHKEEEAVPSVDTEIPPEAEKFIEQMVSLLPDDETLTNAVKNSMRSWAQHQGARRKSKKP
ncbi:DUF721 domain-containing protein, partial [Nitrospirota bacterium]